MHFTLNSVCFIFYDNGEWPSGKAPGFGPGIRGFESLLPSQDFTRLVQNCYPFGRSIPKKSENGSFLQRSSNLFPAKCVSSAPPPSGHTCTL